QAARVFTGGWRDVMEPESIPIAKTANGSPIVFSRDERQRHIYIAGKTGSGKSTLMCNLAMGDFSRGEGVAFIDPHGDAALHLLDVNKSSACNVRSHAWCRRPHHRRRPLHRSPRNRLG